MSAGYQCVALDVLKMHSIGLAGGDELSLLTVFRQLVLSELTYEHLMEIDSTTYRASDRGAAPRPVRVTALCRRC